MCIRDSVKGDAVMSLIITVINFVAGLIIGIVQGGGDFATCLLYTSRCV